MPDSGDPVVESPIIQILERHRTLDKVYFSLASVVEDVLHAVIASDLDPQVIRLECDRLAEELSAVHQAQRQMSEPTT
jgi:hypothetical protein